MALAIADTVLNRGFDVLYTSSAALAAQLGREHFDRAAEDPWLDACKEADLLILDDLGTEYISQLTISVSIRPREKVIRFCRAIGPVNRSRYP